MAVDPQRLELYKLAVEMADRTSSRRLATNSFFVTLQTAVAALTGILGAVFARSATANQRPDVFSLLLLAAVGVILSISWWMLLRYYRRLSTAKFAVINAMESDFPVKPFTEEWATLHPEDQSTVATALRWYQVFKKARRVRHREATVVEQVVPILFAAIYIALGVRLLLL